MTCPAASAGTSPTCRGFSGSDSFRPTRSARACTIFSGTTRRSNMKRRIRIVSLINELLVGGDENRLLSFSRTVDAEHFDHHVVCVEKLNGDADARHGTMRNLYADAG